VPNSVFLGKNQDGRRTGFGTILFENEEECKRAMSEKQGQNIGHRYIELYVISYGDYIEFKNSQSSYNVVKLSKYVTSVNKKRALVMRGLPFKVSVEDIQEFFVGYGNIMKTDIVIEEFNGGKRSGAALVFFENEEMAQVAKNGLNKTNLGQRYVELFDHNDDVMQKVCDIQI
jgi:RNA recognition motif-containing protein